MRGRRGDTLQATQGGEVSGIVVGHDGSIHAQRAAREAMVMARAFGEPVTIVRAFSIRKAMDSESWGSVEPVDEIEVREAVRLKEDTLDLRNEFADVPVTVKAAHGSPASVLLHEGEQARMIVVGSRGLGGLSRLLGSVSERVVAHAKTTVLVVRDEPTA
jgi:nucleotide-binding universal stress UspA family protein